MIPGLVASISIKGKTGLKPTDAQTLKMMWRHVLVIDCDKNELIVEVIECHSNSFSTLS
jgi:hypothetical protein